MKEPKENKRLIQVGAEASKNSPLVVYVPKQKKLKRKPRVYKEQFNVFKEGKYYNASSASFNMIFCAKSKKELKRKAEAMMVCLANMLSDAVKQKHFVKFKQINKAQWEKQIK